MTPSRIAKGFLAVPVAASSLFPQARGDIEVRCDAETTRKCLYVPRGEVGENRIFGLGAWMNAAEVLPGQRAMIRAEGSSYRVSSERYLNLVRERLDHSSSSQHSRLPHAVLDRAIRRARGIAGEFARSHNMAMIEDLQSAMVERAWKAWRDYDPDAGMAWRTWLEKHFDYAVRDVLREHTHERRANARAFHKQFRMVTWDETPTGDSDSLSLTETVASQEDLENSTAMGDWGRGVLAKLFPRERYIVHQHYFLGVSWPDIAVELGVSTTRLRQIEKRAFARIRGQVAQDQE